MSWVRMTMKFPGVCLVCKKQVDKGGPGLWQKGVGVKHEGCAKTDEIGCAICGAPAGCPVCEFSDDCDLARVSRLCVCAKCIEKGDMFQLYVDSVGRKFPALKP